MCVCRATQCVWSSEDNFVEPVSPFTFTWVPGIELEPAGWHSKHLYPQSHLASPCSMSPLLLFLVTGSHVYWAQTQ